MTTPQETTPMRVCDGSCRRLAAIERHRPETATTTALILQLREHAGGLSRGTPDETVELLLRAAETLERLHQATAGRD